MYNYSSVYAPYFSFLFVWFCKASHSFFPHISKLFLLPNILSYGIVSESVSITFYIL